jgi:hypothetical protein
MSTLSDIRKVAIQVSDSDFTCLRIEEELLVMAVRSAKVPMAEKNEIFSRIKEINVKQLELLGEKVRKAS